MKPAQPKVNVAALVDEAAKLHRQVEALEVKQAELRNLQARILEFLDLPASESRTVSGRKSSVLIGSQTFEREIISKPVIFELLGKERYVELASVRLGDLDRALTAEQMEKVTKKTQTGRRRWQYVAGTVRVVA